jgi:hypothetical protein
MINSSTQFHLVGYFCMSYTMMHGSMNIKTLPLIVLRGDTSFEVLNFPGVMARKIFPSIYNFFLLLQRGVVLNKCL